MGFPGNSDGKEFVCNEGDLGSIPGLGRSPGGGHSNPLQCSCLENPHGQKSLAGHSSWGCKESDTTEQLSTAHIINLKNLPTRIINKMYNRVKVNLIGPGWGFGISIFKFLK